MTAATATPPRDEMDLQRLETWLAGRIDGFAGPVRLAKFPGGQSNPTYRLDAGDRSYVLRRKPFGPTLPSAHAVDREHRLIAALHPTGFPVARPVALCEDDTVIGSIFYVMELVDGRSLADGSLPNETPQARGEMYRGLTTALADLHNIDPVAAGLGDYGRPGNYFERQVGRWTKQYRASQTDDIPEVEGLIDYLPRTVPEQTRTSIIHGDYRIDNALFEPEGTRIKAVLDWELSTLGDPLADFTYYAMQWAMPAEAGGAGLDGIDFQASGIPTLDETVALYCDLTGRDSVPAMDWYFAYNLFRLVGIVQGIKKRIIDGNASSDKAEATVARLVPLAVSAWDFARRAGA
ncbi:aminoglycoside phosphotransferase [Maricaulis sp. W15]|uniref:Aminoglycoside phosphotransferase (APT) family kinase protein n=1 Tax=Maricaulis maris TaxID=74318 RepID=A0A495D2T8_9PROT|nr:MULTISPECIES: phosphotransferase family protein [Maricaulis]OLF71355.1 aminoglycoside phosphotransferase [Maricaulis sp. W15]RKQ96085.1 aminoglycoside phosphotransferase (APT) family kinase protein [Maricaulis maris]